PERVNISDDLEVSSYLEVAEAEQADARAAPDSRLTSHDPRVETRDAVAIIDFGSQYSQLIARRVREHHVYCELVPHDAPEERIKALKPKGFILSGGPASVYAPGAPLLPSYI